MQKKLRPTRIRDMNMKTMLKHVFVIALMLCSAITANAQSTVYLFMRSTNCFGTGGYAQIYLNGYEAFSMRGPLKKVMGNVANPSFPAMFYKPTKRKCTLKEEGKVVLAIDYLFVTGFGKESHLTAELQLNLTEGSVHYVKIDYKGLNDIQFKVLSEKEAAKAMKDKKYVELPEYISE